MDDREQPGVRFSVGEPPQMPPDDMPPSAPPAPERRLITPRTTAAIAAGCLIAGLVAGHFVFRSASAQITTLHGSITLRSGDYQFGGGTDVCTAGDGFSDISAGTAVTIGDQTGATIAVGQLQPGHLKQDGSGCMFAFAVQVPGGRTSYTVTISHRGTQVFDAGQDADMVLG